MPGHAEDAEGGARRREALVELHEAGPVPDRVRNPAEIGRDMVTHRKLRVAAGDDARDRLARHHAAAPGRGRIGFTGAPTAAPIGVEPPRAGTGQESALLHVRHFGVLKSKMFWGP